MNADKKHWWMNVLCKAKEQNTNFIRRFSFELDNLFILSIMVPSYSLLLLITVSISS